MKLLHVLKETYTSLFQGSSYGTSMRIRNENKIGKEKCKRRGLGREKVR